MRAIGESGRNSNRVDVVLVGHGSQPRVVPALPRRAAIGRAPDAVRAVDVGGRGVGCGQHAEERTIGHRQRRRLPGAAIDGVHDRLPVAGDADSRCRVVQPGQPGCGQQFGGCGRGVVVDRRRHRPGLAAVGRKLQCTAALVGRDLVEGGTHGQRLVHSVIRRKDDLLSAPVDQVLPLGHKGIAAVVRTPDPRAQRLGLVAGDIEGAIRGVVGREEGVEHVGVDVGRLWQPAVKPHEGGAAVGRAQQPAAGQFHQQRAVGRVVGRDADRLDRERIVQRGRAGRRRRGRNATPLGDDDQVLAALAIEQPRVRVIGEQAAWRPHADRRQRGQVHDRAIFEVALVGVWVDKRGAETFAPGQRCACTIGDAEVGVDDVAGIEVVAVAATGDFTDHVRRCAASSLEQRRQRFRLRRQCGRVEEGGGLVVAAARARTVAVQVDGDQAAGRIVESPIHPLAAVAPEEIGQLAAGQFREEVAGDRAGLWVGGVEGVGHNQQFVAHGIVDRRTRLRDLAHKVQGGAVDDAHAGSVAGHVAGVRFADEQAMAGAVDGDGATGQRPDLFKRGRVDDVDHARLIGGRKARVDVETTIRRVGQQAIAQAVECLDWGISGGVEHMELVGGVRDKDQAGDRVKRQFAQGLLRRREGRVGDQDGQRRDLRLSRCGRRRLLSDDTIRGGWSGRAGLGRGRAAGSQQQRSPQRCQRPAPQPSLYLRCVHWNPLSRQVYHKWPVVGYGRGYFIDCKIARISGP